MTIVMVTAKQLVAGEEFNARKHGKKDGLDELGASIAAHGLIHPIVCRDPGIEEGAPLPKLEVIDGNRRFAAIQKAIKGKAIKADWLFPVMLRKESDDATVLEISLAANTMRKQLHPVEEFDAAAAMVMLGKSEEEIARNAGVEVKVVKQALALARLAPELRAAWLKGEMNAEQAKAMTLTDDHKKQVEVWKKATRDKYSAQYESTPDRLRRALKGEALTAEHRLVRFVGLDAYRAAGGFVREDLFGEDHVCEDEALLRQLVDEKLQAEADRLLADGWGWVKRFDDPAFDGMSKWSIPKLDFRDWMTADERATYDDYKQPYKTRETIKEKAEAAMAADAPAKARSGVVIDIGHDGQLDVDEFRLLVAEPEDESEEGVDETIERDEPEKEKPRITAAEAERLSVVMTHAISKALTGSRHVALAAACATLDARYGSLIRLNPARAGGLRTGNEWSWDEAFTAYVDKPLDDLLTIFARLIATTVDTRISQRMHTSCQDEDVKAIVEAFGPANFNSALNDAFDVAAYLARSPASECDRVADDCNMPRFTGKKAAKVEAATKAAIFHGWLPPELRTAHYAGPTGEAQDDEREAA